jgi:hypothetical protein
MDWPRTTPGDELVERFRPTTGMFVGWTGFVGCIAAIGYVAVARHSLGGLRFALACVLAALVIWVTQLRPRATAYASHLRLHGVLGDTDIPYLAINEVSLGQTLNVFVGRKRYLCVGIGRSVGMEMRQRVRSRGAGQGGGEFAGNRSYQFAGKAETTQVRDQGGSYASFVLGRIEQLVAAARLERDQRVETGDDVEVPPVRRILARAEVGALAVATAAFVLSLLL